MTHFLSPTSNNFASTPHPQSSRLHTCWFARGCPSEPTNFPQNRTHSLQQGCSPQGPLPTGRHTSSQQIQLHAWNATESFNAASATPAETPNLSCHINSTAFNVQPCVAIQAQLWPPLTQLPLSTYFYSKIKTEDQVLGGTGTPQKAREQLGQVLLVNPETL